MTLLPWRQEEFKGWSIVGMNHYFIYGNKRLFVAVCKDNVCLKEEGEDDHSLWRNLSLQIKKHENKTT